MTLQAGRIYYERQRMTDIVWSNVTVTLGQLQPWERNPYRIEPL